MAQALETGQVWRLSDGQVVRLAEVSGDDVNGTAQVATRSSSGAPIHAGAAVWAGRRSDFDDAELVGPLFRVSFLFPAAGSQDPVVAALEAIGSVLHRSGGRIETGTGQDGGNLNLSEVEWTVDVVARDGDHAKERVIKTLAPYGDVKPGSRRATEIPVD